MAKRASTTAFPAGTRVELFGPGAVHPGEGTNGTEARTVKKDGTVAFDIPGPNSLIGRTVWLAGDVDGEWRTVQAPVKEGKAADAENPADVLARVAAPNQAEEDLVTGARSTRNTRTSNRTARDPNEKLPHASLMSGSEALRVSASGSFVTIPDGSHADPAAHEPVVPAHTDGLTAEEREAKREARARHRKQTGKAKARPKKSAQAPSSKTASGQPTKAEATIDKPTPEPEPEQRTAL